MDQTSIHRHLTESFADVQTAEVDGMTFYFYGADRKLQFAVVMNKDNAYDRASNLDRPGVFRLDIGVSRDTYRSLFGQQPARPGAEGVVNTGHDFTALDQLMPHP